MIDISPLKSLTDHKFFNLIAEKAINESVTLVQSNYLMILVTLNSNNISQFAVQQLSMKGVLGDNNNLRSITWKYLLGYIGNNINNWEDEIDAKRAEYDELINQFSSQITISKEQSQKAKSKTKINVDHPLSTISNSVWNKHFQDVTLVKSIDKDLKRTRNEMDFFQNVSKNNKTELNIDVLRRILFIYAKRHPDVSYVQGLNEILAPIYYCFAKDENPYFSMGAEADSFFCFENLLKDIKNIYIKALDNTEEGIDTVLFNLSKLLKYMDNEIFAKLEELKIDYHFFAFQWTTLMFTQQFTMPDVLRLWDIILANDDKFKIINEISVSILKCKKQNLLCSDFSIVMDTLQNFEDVDIMEKIINKRVSLRTTFDAYYSSKEK